MKILYISPKIPYPLSDGGRLRVFNHIKYLSKEHEVISLSFVKNKKELKNIDELRECCSIETVLMSKWKSLVKSFFGLLFSKKPMRIWYLINKIFREKSRRLTKEVDIVIIQSLRMCQYGFDSEKTLVDIVDTPSLQIKRALKYEKWVWKLVWKMEYPRIKNYEKEVCKKFNKILVASKSDKEALGKGIVLKNGTEINKIDRERVEENNIMFLGNMEYHPNIDAVEYFIDKIFPMVKKKVKDAKFFIVGKNPGKMKIYESKDVVVTGFVEDLGEYFSKCKVFAAPLRLGSGIQNKVLEALNYEIPVVTTSIVNNGIEAEDGKELMIADNKKDFANKITELLKSDELRKKMSKKGKNFLKKNYSWKNIYRKLDGIISDLL